MAERHSFRRLAPDEQLRRIRPSDADRDPTPYPLWRFLSEKSRGLDVAYHAGGMKQCHCLAIVVMLEAKTDRQKSLIRRNFRGFLEESKNESPGGGGRTHTVLSTTGF
jgi:hypothetical protein